MATTQLLNTRDELRPAVVRRRSAGRWWRETGWRHVVGVVAVVFAAFPMVYVVSASFSVRGTLSSANHLFATFTTAQYAALFNDPLNPFAKWFGNTMVVATVTAIGTVLIGAAAAYAFSRFRFRGRRGGLLSLIVIQMFPQLLAYVAIFLLLQSLGEVFPVLGLDSIVGLIMVYLGGALGVNTYLMYGFFNTVPRELDEAAKIDGASHAQIFFGLILRLTAPILAIVGLLSFIASFNDVLLAKVILVSPEHQTLAVGLFSFVSDQFAKNWGVFAAGAVLSALPIVLLFMFLQRYIVSGLTAGSVKG